MEEPMRKTSTDTLLKASKNKDTEKTRELTMDELNHVSGGGGKPSAAPKQDAFPTETIKLNYGSIEWTYT
jgi:bacteriocin-like protein